MEKEEIKAIKDYYYGINNIPYLRDTLETYESILKVSAHPQTIEKAKETIKVLKMKILLEG